MINIKNKGCKEKKLVWNCLAMNEIEGVQKNERQQKFSKENSIQMF